MKRLISYILCILCIGVANATHYVGRIVDERGQGIGYATVYPEQDPVVGAATNDNGYFVIDTNLPAESPLIISFIGYEKQTLPLGTFAVDTATIVLREQPIALEETVVAAKASKQRNKRKQMAALLHSVYVQMERDFADEPVRYHLVSDVWTPRAKRGGWNR